MTPNLQRRHHNYFKKGKQVLQIEATPEEINQIVKELSSSGHKNIRVTKHNKNSNVTQITYTTPKNTSNTITPLSSSIQMNSPQGSSASESYVKPITLKRTFNKVKGGKYSTKNRTQKKKVRVCFSKKGKKTRCKYMILSLPY